MRTRILKASLIISVLVNVVAIPLLTWNLIGSHLRYRAHVDYAAELAYGVGYHRALGHDLATELDNYPTRLQITAVTTNSVQAKLYPGKILKLEFSEPSICYASIWSETD